LKDQAMKEIDAAKTMLDALDQDELVSSGTRE